MDRTRRNALLATVSALVLVGLGSPLHGDLFVPSDNDSRPIISFKQAHSLVDGLVKSELEKSAKDFDTRYSSDEADNIRNRLWETTQVVLLRHYRPEESTP
jgi:hypothetical protein